MIEREKDREVESDKEKIVFQNRYDFPKTSDFFRF
jgi:hypothetical protein